MITNLAIGMILRDDVAMLRRTVPVYDKMTKETIVVDTGSKDGGWEYLHERGWLDVLDDWHDDYSAARNKLISIAEFGDADWLLMLDADEAMYPKDIELLAEFVRTVKEPVVMLPRYNLAGPGFDWFDHGYPDYQSRVIKLGAGVTFSGKIHEQAVVGGAFAEKVAGPVHIYHYGYCRDPARVWFRHHNYNLIAAGAPMIEESAAKPPADVANYVAAHGVKPFKLKHPLAP